LGGARALSALLAAAVIAAIALPARGAERYTKGLLWQVVRPGVAPSYVFGTIHLPDPRALEIPEPVLRALGEARSYAMEAPQWDGHDWRLYEAAQFDDGRSLEGVVGAETFAQVRAALAPRGIPEPVLARLKPWAALANIVVAPEGYAHETLDQRLFALARERRLKFETLEGTEEHIAVFDGIPLATQVAMLRHTLEHRDALAAMIEPTLQAWLRRDLAGIHAVNERIAARYPAMAPHYRLFVRHLVENRSVTMAHRLHLRLRGGGMFVAVGATHLYGEKGILRLIERQGYRVSRLY
jgi:uncharacterized protein YbaP (TraB family)